ncbi:MAG: hypothetical protein ACLUTE_09905 [Dorea longicatena]
MNKEENTYYKNSPKFGRKGPSKLRQQFNRGMTYFLVIVACILVYFAMLRVEAISNTLSKILAILKPVLYGCGIAYLLNPIVKSVDAYLVPVLEKHMKERKSEEGFQKYRSDRGAGCIDYGCIDIDQYADTGTDHKYP